MKQEENIWGIPKILAAIVYKVWLYCIRPLNRMVEFE